ncbi:MAG: hypothetical protein E7122_07915 [Bacteroidales bacterium]|nr:hypothetical protein [Bacteroidales bacterium]
MKRVIFLLSILGALLAESCNTQKSLNDVQVQIPFEEHVPYSFEHLTDPAVWITFNTTAEMKEACQLPEVWLKNMTTENLIITCMNYPLLLNYGVYQNNMDGVKAVVNGFNGFQELSRRADAPEKLMSFYKNLQLQDSFDALREKAFIEHNSIFKIGFLELYFAAGYIPSLFEDDICEILKEDVERKLEEKLKKSNVYSLNAINSSLVVNSAIKVNSGNHSFSQVEIDELDEFVKGGGSMSPEKLSNISKILFK